MNRRKWLWAALLAVPAAVAGGLIYANTQRTGGCLCPITGEELLCEKCCPLNGSRASEGQGEKPKQAKEGGYICPVTGEELPCPNCCPLNGQQ